MDEKRNWDGRINTNSNINNWNGNSNIKTAPPLTALSAIATCAVETATDVGERNECVLMEEKALAFTVCFSFFSIFLWQNTYFDLFDLFSLENWKLTRRHCGVHCSVERRRKWDLFDSWQATRLLFHLCDGGDGGGDGTAAVVLHHSARTFAIWSNFILDGCRTRSPRYFKLNRKTKIKTNRHLLKSSFTSCLSLAAWLCGRRAKFFPFPFRQLIDVYIECLVELPLCRAKDDTKST